MGILRGKEGECRVLQVFAWGAAPALFSTSPGTWDRWVVGTWHGQLWLCGAVQGERDFPTTGFPKRAMSFPFAIPQAMLVPGAGGANSS